MAEYIDREALLKNFCGFDLTECVKYGNKTKEQTARSYGTLMMYEIADVIEDAPAADVAPVVHGRWESCIEDWRQQIEGSKCSVCGYEHYAVSILNYNYCPGCGAKMDGNKT